MAISDSIFDVLEQRDEDFSASNSPQVEANILSAYKFILENVEQFPWQKLADAGWISDSKDKIGLAKRIAHIGLTADKLNRPLFRQKNDVNEFIVEMWLKSVDAIALEHIIYNSLPPFSRDSLNKKYLNEIAKLSVSPSNVTKVAGILASIGILLIIQPAPKGTKTDGVVYLAPTGNPIIGLTLRYSRLDYFWFTLLHELSHIQLHYDLLENPIVDEIEPDSKNIVEVQANLNAKDSIVPRYLWERCEPRFNPTEPVLTAFAESVGVHPALVAGLLQYDLKRYDLFREIVDEVDVRSLF